MHSELPAGPLLDVGSGAGFPGLPLAILQPDRQVTLLDSNGKKVRFLSHVIRQLKLNNAQAVHRRAEDLDGAGEFAVITSRAFSTLETFVGSVRHLLVPETVLMAMKGRTPDDEITALPADILVDNVIPLSVPGLDAERHLAVLRLNTNNDNA